MSALLNRERVLRAATAAFTLDGYRASIDRIAQRAGVAKQTVYSHFPSKEELFKEVVRELAARILVQLEGGEKMRDDDVRAGLLRFAALARAIYAGGPGETARGLARYLEKAMAAGRLRRDDPRFAAEVLLGML